MEINIKVIKFTSIISAILFFLTYVFTLVDTFNWFNISWLPNSFLVMMLGGAFASSLVVLFCEIHKYFVNKKDAKGKIFFHIAFLYCKITMIKKEIDKHLNNPNQEIIFTLDNNMNDCLAHINLFRNVDYNTFTKKDKLMKIFNSVIFWFNSEVEPSICDINFIKIAKYKDELECLMNTRKKCIITSSSENTNKALVITQKKLELFLSQLDKIILDIDACCKQKHRWEIKKSSILKGLDIEERDSLKAFFSQEENINDVYEKLKNQ